MARSTQHMCLSVRGALTNWKDKELKGMFTVDGRKSTAAESKQLLMDELVQGHEVVPFGPACEGFDYSGGGCPGHPVEEAVTA